MCALVNVFSPTPPFASIRSRAMAAPATTSDPDAGGPPLDLLQYPTPLSPPHPPLSRPLELRRALAASSRSALFALTPSHIIFQDDSLAVVNKPPGIYCDALLSAFSHAHQLLDETPHLANRLDRDTSGLMVITKTRRASGELTRAFSEHSVCKAYVARCIGAVPSWRRIRVVSGHGRSRHGAWRVYAASDVGRVLPGGSVVRRMETVLEVGGGAEEEEVVVVEGMGKEGGAEKREVVVRAWPRSGRTHQIRLHCQYLGLPIRGDVKYGGVHEWEGEECGGHDLHAESLAFDHPVTGEKLSFRAPPPTWAPMADR